MASVTTYDGAKIFYKESGTGPPVVFSHGWPLHADVWDAHMALVASYGFHAVAHDRRGHGRSTQTWRGNDLNTYADDLAQVIEALGLREVTLVGHSAGGSEIARYVGRHGTTRVARIVLLGSVSPQVRRTEANPLGLAPSVLDTVRESMCTRRSGFFQALTRTFFGANRPGHTVTREEREAYWLMSMALGTKGASEGVESLFGADLTEDLRRVDVPTLVLHGDEDQIAPLEATGRRSASLVPGAALRVYPGAPHAFAGMRSYREPLGRDLLGFLRS